MTSKQKQKHPSIFYPCVKLDTIQNPPTQQQQKQKHIHKERWNHQNNAKEVRRPACIFFVFK